MADGAAIRAVLSRRSPAAANVIFYMIWLDFPSAALNFLLLSWQLEGKKK
jgi:hypothetical protein